MKLPDYFQKIPRIKLTMKKATLFGAWLIAILFVLSILSAIVVYFGYTTRVELPGTDFVPIQFTESDFTQLMKLIQQRKEAFGANSKVAIPNAFR